VEVRKFSLFIDLGEKKEVDMESGFVFGEVFIRDSLSCFKDFKISMNVGRSSGLNYQKKAKKKREDWIE
jgi:hypothetical protein